MQATKTRFTPSVDQQNILDWLRAGNGNGCITAVAGSGKSTTLHLAAKQIEESGIDIDDIRVIVFGKANAEDLIAKFGERWKNSISTLHSAGWSLIKDNLELHGKQNLIDSYKYKKIAQRLGLIYSRGKQGSLITKGAIDNEKESSFINILDLVRLTGSKTTLPDVRKIIDHYEIRGIRSARHVAEAIGVCLHEGLRMAKDKESFDFADQVWLPSIWNLKPNYPIEFCLVDERQDLNKAQLSLIRALVGKDGRILAVGDEKQSIFGFAGADCEAYNTFLEDLSAKEFPLSTCYRCPSSHISLVNKIYPEIPIKAKVGALEGNIKYIKPEQINEHLQEDDLVICRMTAPLVSLCIKLIASGIAAKVKGKDIGAQLAKEIDTIDPYGSERDYEQFTRLINIYVDNQTKKFKYLDNSEVLTANLIDRTMAIEAVYLANPSLKCSSELKETLKQLFSDDKSPVTLATCHRTKGLEAERVFLYEATSMPLRWKGQGDWQLEQEKNLLYVALTRSKQDLFIVAKVQPEWLRSNIDN